MSSPVQTVNDLMTWLNNKFGLDLPVLPASPFEGWSVSLVALWQMAVNFISGSPVEAKVPIEGTWTMDVPGGAHITLSDLTVNITDNPDKA
jgi:hypothetical protein